MLILHIRVYVDTWNKQALKHCSGETLGSSYNTLASARSACVSRNGCTGVFDSGCDGLGNFFMCNAKAYATSSSSCVYAKPSGDYRFYRPFLPNYWTTYRFYRSTYHSYTPTYVPYHTLPYVNMYLPTYQLNYLPTYLPAYPSRIYQRIYPPTHVRMYLPIYMPYHLP